MYKISFCPRRCAWIIQLSRCAGLYWSTLKGKTFPNYISATDYIKTTGIDQVYKDYQHSTAHSYAQIATTGGR